MRARNIKPGFFRNEQLMQVAPLGRLLFAGLWCLADREGRLLDRPNQIKWDVLPADDCDIDALLDDLAGRGFIRRYEAEGRRCIQIPSFLRHQHPHPKEKAKSIPPPPDTAPAQKQRSTRLNPESLNPDILIPESSQLVRSKYDLPLQLEDYRPPTEEDRSLSRIAIVWQSLTGETVSLTDRQHIRQALARGHSEEAITDLITSLVSTAQAKPLRLSTNLAAELAKKKNETSPPSTDTPAAHIADTPSSTDTPAAHSTDIPPSADTLAAHSTDTPPSTDTPAAHIADIPPSADTPADTVPKPPNFFNRKDGNARTLQARKPKKPSNDWQEGFFLR